MRRSSVEDTVKSTETAPIETPAGTSKKPFTIVIPPMHKSGEVSVVEEAPPPVVEEKKPLPSYKKLDDMSPQVPEENKAALREQLMEELRASREPEVAPQPEPVHVVEEKPPEKPKVLQAIEELPIRREEPVIIQPAEDTPPSPPATPGIRSQSPEVQPPSPMAPIYRESAWEEPVHPRAQTAVMEKPKTAPMRQETLVAIKEISRVLTAQDNQNLVWLHGDVPEDMPPMYFEYAIPTFYSLGGHTLSTAILGLLIDRKG